MPVTQSFDIDLWQYHIFKWALFIFFLVYLYRFADSKIHISQFLLGIGKFGIALVDAILAGARQSIRALRFQSDLQNSKRSQPLDQTRSRRELG
jgi:hypothetical protein